MANEKRLIDANTAYEELSSLSVVVTGIRAGKGVLNEYMKEYRNSVLRVIDEQRTVDAVEVVRCEKCVYCVNDEEEPGMCKCVESAEYDSESGFWLGFVEYHTPDFFCAFGERRSDT